MLILERNKALEGYSEEIIREYFTVEYPEGFRQRLEGKSIEEQMKLFALLENVSFSSSSYGSVDSERLYSRAKPVTDLHEFRGVIVNEGLMEGILIHTFGSDRPLMLFRTATTYYASDDNGSGSKEREDTATLICLPPDREWE